MQRILSAVTGKAAEVTAAEGAATFKPVLMKSERGGTRFVRVSQLWLMGLRVTTRTLTIVGR